MLRSAVFALAASCLVLGALSADPIVTLPKLGPIRGRVHQTFGNGVPKKDYFNFRNIPFAESVSGDKRFTVRKTNNRTQVSFDIPS